MLPIETREKIRKDADNLADMFARGPAQMTASLKAGYVVGATAWAEKSLKLVTALRIECKCTGQVSYETGSEMLCRACEAIKQFEEEVKK